MSRRASSPDVVDVASQPVEAQGSRAEFVTTGTFSCAAVFAGTRTGCPRRVERFPCRAAAIMITRTVHYARRWNPQPSTELCRNRGRTERRHVSIAERPNDVHGSVLWPRVSTHGPAAAIGCAQRVRGTWVAIDLADGRVSSGRIRPVDDHDRSRAVQARSMSATGSDGTSTSICRCPERLPPRSLLRRLRLLS